jgi:hypothetical protein
MLVSEQYGFQNARYNNKNWSKPFEFLIIGREFG